MLYKPVGAGAGVVVAGFFTGLAAGFFTWAFAPRVYTVSTSVKIRKIDFIRRFL